MIKFIKPVIYFIVKQYINLLLKENNFKLAKHTMNSANSEFIKYYVNTDNVSLKKINDVLNK